MEIKVKEVSSEQKSIAEVEEKLLKEHEQQVENSTADSEGVEASTESAPATNTEESVQPKEEA